MTASDLESPISQPEAEPVAAERITIAARRGPRRRSRVNIRAAEQSGQALVEFALILPIVLLILLGIGWFGLALNTENDETHLANEVARYAIVNENPGGAAEELQNWAVKQGDSNFLKSSGKVCISFPEGAEAGRPVKVVAESTLDLIPKLFPVKTLKGTAYMRLEATPSNTASRCSK